jgi:hypothetical protein
MLVASESSRVARGARRGIATVAACLLLCAVTVGASVLETGRLSFSGSPTAGTIPEAAALGELVQHLEARGIGHVYCFGPMLQWKVMFASRGRVVARWSAPRDRVAAYVAAVDGARAANRPIALIGEARSLETTRTRLARSGFPDEPVFVADRYFVVEQPSPELLTSFLHP